MTKSDQILKVRLVAIRYEAQGVVSFVLAPVEPAVLPAFGAGSHVDVRLSASLTRSYSLSNGVGDEGLYRLTIQKDPNSRGGSNYMHDTLRVGQILEISVPHNHFALNEDAASSIFIAGGIGITPFLPMMARLNTLGKPWRLHYCVRTRERAALLREIQALADSGIGEVVFNFDEEPGGAALDLKKLVSELGPEEHLYCCGPTGMLYAYQAATANLAQDRVHFEFFANVVPSAAEGGFTVVMARSGGEVQVRKGQTILQALRDAGVSVQSSCEEGVCGACETKVISGLPDHRDTILGPRERAANATMMICCSGCKSERLVLDI